MSARTSEAHCDLSLATEEVPPVKYWGIIADNLSETGWSWCCVSAIDSQGRTIWIADAHNDGKRFIVRADEKLTAFWTGKGDLRVRGGCNVVEISPLLEIACAGAFQSRCQHHRKRESQHHVTG